MFKGGGSGGVGDGTFQEANVIGGLGQPRSVAAGDLNGDTIPDLAVADYFGSMHILIGNGNGTFQGPTVVPAGQNPTDVALGDFNLDGTLDAVVANYMTDYMTVFMSFCPTGPPPEVHSLSPAAGLPGAQVTIAGSNFVNVASVRFNGLEAAYTVLSDSEIRATVPPLALSGPVRVHTANGTDLGPVFTVAPRITGFAPSQAPAGTIVSINGVNFIGTTAVEFNGTPCVVRGQLRAVAQRRGSERCHERPDFRDDLWHGAVDAVVHRRDFRQRRNQLVVGRLRACGDFEQELRV